MAATAAAAAAVEAAASAHHSHQQQQHEKSKLAKSENLLKRNSTFNETLDSSKTNASATHFPSKIELNRSPTSFSSLSQSQLTPSPQSSSSNQNDVLASAASLVSKRTALYEQKSGDDLAKTLAPQPRTLLAKTSPNKFISKNDSKDLSPVDDIEMMSSSPSSSSSSSSSSASSSYKENKRPPQFIENMNDLNNASELSSSGSAKEPSKLSLSEKMKLFSTANHSSNNNVNYNSFTADPALTRQKSLNKRNFNRFQTQVFFCKTF